MKRYQRIPLLALTLGLSVSGAAFGLDSVLARADGFDAQGKFGEARNLLLAALPGMATASDKAAVYWRLSREFLGMGDNEHGAGKSNDAVIATYKEGERYAEKAIQADPGNAQYVLVEQAQQRHVLLGAKSLDAALGTTGLAAVANEMVRTAEDHARHFTHPGPARDDAIALFWQVAPAAFADPAVFAAAHLDPALTTERMIAAIKASAVARDFTAAPLPEAFFRAVARATLEVMLTRADTVAALAPALWRSRFRQPPRSRTTPPKSSLSSASCIRRNRPRSPRPR